MRSLSRSRAIGAANRPEAKMDALFRDEEKRDTALLNEGLHPGKAGGFVAPPAARVARAFRPA